MLLNGSCGQYRLCNKRNLLFCFGACLHTQQTRRRPNAVPMLAHPVNTNHLYNICTMLGQRRIRWAGVVQMLYKCFVFAGNSSWSGDDYN